MPIINGTSGDDTLTGTDGPDEINGLEGDDTIDAGAGDDQVSGGPGNDTITGSSGSNILDGGAGNDRINSYGTDSIFGSDGNDDIRMYGAGSADGGDGDDYIDGRGTIHGGLGHDRIAVRSSASVWGDDGNDALWKANFDPADVVFYGGLGDDTISSISRRGNDVVDAGSGNDLIRLLPTYGYTGSRVFLGEGQDTVHLYAAPGLSGFVTVLDFTIGDAGDLLEIEPGTLYGWDGTSNLFTGGYLRLAQIGQDVLVQVDFDGFSSESYQPETYIVLAGIALADLVATNVVRWIVDNSQFIGTSAADSYTGTSRKDAMEGESGDDTLFGHGGHDTLDGGAGLDRLYGGTGNDSYIVSDASDYVYEYAGEGTDTVFASVTHWLRDNIENLTLTGTGNITGRGNEQANVIIGNAGVNRLIGGGGDDHLYGEAGNDRLEGNAGIDRLYGGLGNDIYAVSDSTDYIYELVGEGYDIVYASVSYWMRDNIERLYLTGTANLTGRGSEQDNSILGNEGANLLIGGGGDDRLYGYGGNDRLDGGAGVDRMYGGAGNDVYVVSDGTDYAYEAAGEGVDAVYASVTNVLRDNIERLYLTGSDAISGYGNELANVIVGNAAGNLLAGRGGNDWIEGKAGDDILYGEDGNDWLEGGSGLDRFTGGSGADRFVFRDGDLGTSAETADQVHDFSQAERDQIHLDAVDADTTTGGRQDFAFIGSTAFTGTAGELRFEQVAGNTLVQGDTNGDGAADFWIRLDGLHTLESGDFIL